MLQLERLVAPVMNSGYITYMGSLTTPACGERVLWLVMEERLEVAPHQLHQFRRLWDEEGEPLGGSAVARYLLQYMIDVEGRGISPCPAILLACYTCCPVNNFRPVQRLGDRSLLYSPW